MASYFWSLYIGSFIRVQNNDMFWFSLLRTAYLLTSPPQLVESRVTGLAWRTTIPSVSRGHVRGSSA